MQNPKKAAEKTPNATPPTGSGASARKSPLETYRPAKNPLGNCTDAEWAKVAPTVRQAVSPLTDVGDARLRLYLSGMCRLAVWASREGLPLDLPTLLSQRVIEAHAAALPANSGTRRSLLRRIAQANGITQTAPSASIARPDYKPPYSEQDIRALLRFGNAMSNLSRRRQIVGVVLLGAGFGIVRTELRHITPAASHEHNGRIFVPTPDRCAGLLHWLADEWKQYLSWCGPDPLFPASAGANLTYRIGNWVNDRAGLPEWSVDRLRSHYVCAHLNSGVSIRQVMAECGFQRLDALKPYIGFLPEPDQHICANNTNSGAT